MPKELAKKKELLFPQKIWCLLDECHDESIRWDADGLLIIIDIQKFVESHVVHKYFKNLKWTSFVRQLNLYKFKKVYTPLSEKVGCTAYCRCGALNGISCYSHESFRKDRPDLVWQMRAAKRGKTVQKLGDESLFQQPAGMRENRSLSVLPDSEKIVSSNAGNNDVNEAIEQRDGLQHSSYLKLSLNCQSGLPINTTNVMITSQLGGVNFHLLSDLGRLQTFFVAKDESFASHEYDLACQVEIDTSFDTTVDTVSDFETCALDLSYPDPDGSSLIEPSMNDEYHSLSIDTLSNHF